MKKIILFLLSLYKNFSFLFPTHCIYTPSCFEYVKEAFLKYPLLKALKVSIKRLLRCHPFRYGGYDLLE